MYTQPTLLKKIIEYITWSALVLLVPLATIGFFSEKTIPGQQLYPVKRGIEQIVLAFDSFDKDAQALYTVYLVDRRFNETENLLANKTIALNTSQIGDFTSQIESARDTINSIADIQERTLLRQKLIQNISDYKNQLASLQQLPPAQSSPQVTSIPAQNSTPPVLAPSFPPPQNPVSQLTQSLQDLQNQLQQDQQNSPPLPASPTPSQQPLFSPTPVPSSTPTPTPNNYLQNFPPTPTPTISRQTTTAILTPTPTPQQQANQGNGWGMHFNFHPNNNQYQKNSGQNGGNNATGSGN